MMSLCWSLDKIGPITRRTVDTAYVLAAIQGLDPRDPSSVGVPFASDPERPIDGLRIGWNPAWFESASDADRAVLTARPILPMLLRLPALGDLRHPLGAAL